MKNYLFAPLVSLATLALAACGTDSGHFKIDGRFLNLNQGEFYVYSLEGGGKAIDTIKVQAGRFTYNVECATPKTLMVVFPNFTEQPVFAEPGKSVDIKGDASHLKEMTVKGTKDNELMNDFRKQIHSASPPEQLKYARQFVEDHPASAVSAYLVRRYFVACDNPDLRTAATLLKRMIAAQPDNVYLPTLLSAVNDRVVLSRGAALPQFKTSTVGGSLVSSQQLSAAPTAVVVAWATYNYGSVAMLRAACTRQKESGGKIMVLGVCLDPSVELCRRTLRQNDLPLTSVCDGRMIDGSLFNRLGLSSLPDNIVLKGGRVAGVSLSSGELLDMLK